MTIIAATLELSACQLQYCVTPTPNKASNYYTLINPEKEKHLRLYSPAMKKLVENLPAAMARAREMEFEDLPDNHVETIEVLNKRGPFETTLFVSMYEGSAFVFARLFSTKDNVKRPTTLGVRFSLSDDLAAIQEFYDENQ